MISWYSGINTRPLSKTLVKSLLTLQNYFIH